MTTAPTTQLTIGREVTITVLPTPEILCADGAELRPAKLVTIRAPTKAGDVTGLYLLLDCGPKYARLVKVGPKPDTYTLTLREGRACTCTCQAATFRPERGECKHAASYNLLAEEKFKEG